MSFLWRVWSSVYSRVSDMLRPSGSPSTQHRSVSKQSGVRSSKRRKSISAGKDSRKASQPRPSLLPDDGDELASGSPTAAEPGLKSQQPQAANILPALLTNPVCVNYDGKHMDFDNCHVSAMIDQLPDMLKSIKRLCVGLELSARPGQQTAEREPVARRSPCTAAPLSQTSVASPAGVSGAPNAAVPAFVAVKRRSDSAAAVASTASDSAASDSATAAASTTDVDRILQHIRAVEALLFPIAKLQSPRSLALPIVAKTTAQKGKATAATKKGSSSFSAGNGAGASRSTSPAGHVQGTALSYYCASLLSVTPKKRRLAWKALLHSSSNAWALLLGALKSPPAMTNPLLCSELLTLLHNMLRNIPATSVEASVEKEKKAVRLCERLGIAKLLGVLLKHYHLELQGLEQRAIVCGDINPNDAAVTATTAASSGAAMEQYRCVRILESVALLYTVVGRVNVKVNTMLRLSHDLRRMLDAAQYVSLASVLRTLQSHSRLSDFGCLSTAHVARGCSAGASKTSCSAALREALVKNRKDGLHGLEAVARATSFPLSALSHLLVSMFVSCRTVLASQELGLKGVALCLRLIEGLSRFLYSTMPKVRQVIIGQQQSGTDGDATRDSTTLREPAWVAVYRRRLEVTLFWSVALLQRLCEKDKKADFTGELHDGNRALASLFFVLRSTGRESVDGDNMAEGGVDGGGDECRSCSRSRSDGIVPNESFTGVACDLVDLGTSSGGAGSDSDDSVVYMSENEEMTLAVMAAMRSILSRNRARSLADLRGVCGGLSGVVSEVLTFRSKFVEQWHRYYMLLAAMYGVRLLPARKGESAYELDARLPPALLALPATTTAAATTTTNSVAAAEISCLGGSPRLDSSAGDVNISPARLASAAPAATDPDAMATPRSGTTTPRASHPLAHTAGELNQSPEQRAVVASSPASAPRHELSPSVSREVSSGLAPFTPAVAAAVPPSASPMARDSLSVSAGAKTSPTVHDARSDLLLVDRNPTCFSPELRLGYGTDHSSRNSSTPRLLPESLLGPDEVSFPWTFTDAGPPPTNLIVGHRNEPGVALPLQGPSREARIRILKHHIARLRRLTESATDETADPAAHHTYDVVYERDDAITAYRRRSLVVGKWGSVDDVAAVESSANTRGSGSEPRPSSASATPALNFFSNFEGGNLKRVVRMGVREYDLVLNWDTSTNGFTQWFCFGMEDYELGATYRFNIVNMEKKSSCFNEGQRPLTLLVAANDAKDNPSFWWRLGRMRRKTAEEAPDWQRAGYDIYYFRNPYGHAPRASMQGRPLPVVSQTSAAPATPSVGPSPASRRTGRPSPGRRDASRSPSRGLGKVSQAPHNVPLAGKSGGKGRGGAGGGGGASTGSDRGHSTGRAFVRHNLRQRTPSMVASEPVKLCRSSSTGAASGGGTVLPTQATVSSPATAILSAAPPLPPPLLAELDTDCYTLTFTLTMPMKQGTLYVANCFPYTYTELRSHLRELQESSTNSASTSDTHSATTGRYVAVQSLCRTLGGLPVPLLTITARERGDGSGSLFSPEEIAARPVCVLTARIHPGETNSSWMMHGMLEALVRPHAVNAPGGVAKSHHRAANEAIRRLLEAFVFKVVPMLNPDGVAMGNHRCSLAGVDLNRDYLRPNPEVNPTIYCVHRYMQHVIEREGRPVVLFADFHGHSKAKNFLMYGCTQALADGLARRLAEAAGLPAPAPASGDLNTTSMGTASAVNAAASPTEADVASGAVLDASAAAPSDDVAYEKLFPILLDRATEFFALAQCSFSMQKAMRKTGRIIQYRKYGIRMSYTIEGTMAGGSGADFVCPWLVDEDNHSHPLANSNSSRADESVTCRGAETHYTQDTYSVMGHSFLSTLHTLVAIEQGTRPTSDETRPSNSVPAVPTELLRGSWEQLTRSGTGKAPPHPPLQAEVGSQQAAVSLAGAYALNTRSARRGGNSTLPPHSQGANGAASPGQSPLTGSPLQPVCTIVSELEEFAVQPTDEELRTRYHRALHYLLSTAPARVADEGDNVDDSADDDSDGGGGGGGPRITPSGRRRITPVGAKKNGGASVPRRRVGAKRPAAANTSAVATLPVESIIAGPHSNVEAQDITRESLIHAPTAVFNPGCIPEAAGEPHLVGAAWIPQPPVQDGTPRGDLDAEVIAPCADGDDGDFSGSENGFIISLSDVDDEEDEEEQCKEAVDASAENGGRAVGGMDGDNATEQHSEDDCGADDSDAYCGALEPMPSNVFS